MLSNSSQHTSNPGIIAYHGAASQQQLDQLLDDLETMLEQGGYPAKTRKKVYNVAVEMLQNAFQYITMEFCEEDQDLQQIHFEVLQQTESYQLRLSNFIRKTHLRTVKSRIEEVNALSAEGLKERYRTVLRNSEFSERGGGGLGFYDMARKSGKKLHFSIKEYGHDMVNFTLTILIPA